jgi:alginate O-acetyltransferase complex protein AlgI
MLFDSPVYFLFLALVVLIYWRLRFRPQNLFLLAASCFFYGWWDWRFLLLMLSSAVVDFVIGRRLDSDMAPASRKWLLITSLIVNFGVLGAFKYFNFFVGSFTSAFGISGIPKAFLAIVLPPGISFYTFQEVAYIIDVYKRRLPASRRFVDYALFISLFPHLVAGPIQRPSHLLPQVQEPRTWDPAQFFDGMLLILEGLFRKCVIADNCALIANAAFNGKLGGPNIPVFLIGIYAFAWQIYGDFSAYSNIARGSAQLLGFHFMVNFRQPYLSLSLQDFWRRWHISLSTWLRDYLYIPLGGNRKGGVRTYVNLIATMLLGGLWHGANWTFLFWGGIHGAGLALERVFTQPECVAFASRWFRRVLIFHLVCLAWVFFRADSITVALASLGGLRIWEWRPEYAAAAKFLAIFSLPLFLLDLHLEATGDEYLLQSRGYSQRVAAGFGCIVSIILFGANQANAFIYFQF